MYWSRGLRRLGTYQSCRNLFRRLFRRCRTPLGACLRIGVHTRGAIIFFSMAGWIFRARLIFFFNFQEILAQELHQNLGPEPGPKPWSRSWSQNVVQKLHQKIGSCGFCIGAPQWVSFLQSHFEWISAPSFGINSISLAKFLVQFLDQVFGAIPEPKNPKTWEFWPRFLGFLAQELHQKLGPEIGPRTWPS